MTYDEHGIWGEPGSVASTNWIKSSLQFSVKKIKANKVIMGIPAYGYDWDVIPHDMFMLLFVNIRKRHRA